MTTTIADPVLKQARPDDPRLAHLVLKPDWPVALCGATVEDRLGAAAPGLDRCTTCLKLAAECGLGTPGWTT